MDNQNTTNLAKRKKIMWISIIILVIIGVLWLIFTLFQSQQNPSPDIYSIDQQPVFETPSPNLEVVPVAPEANLEFSVANLAKTFVARFGSWSTDNQGQNLQQLLPLATARMQNYINNIAIDYQRADFYGVSTKSLSAEIKNLDAENGQAEVVVHTQRKEINQDLEENIYYQDVVVFLSQVNDQWLVNQANWQ